MRELLINDKKSASVLDVSKSQIMGKTGMEESGWSEYKSVVIQSLYKLQVAFPTQARNFDTSESNALTLLWLEIFAEVKPWVLAEAVTLFIKNDRSGFFPSPGQIMGAVEEILETMPQKRFIQTGVDDAGNATGYFEELL